MSWWPSCACSPQGGGDPRHTQEIQYYASIYFNHDSVFFHRAEYRLRCGAGGLPQAEESPISTRRRTPQQRAKHGTISLIEDGTLVVALASWNTLFDKLMSNVKGGQGPGARTSSAFPPPATGEQLDALVDSAMTIGHPSHVPALSGGHPHAAVCLLCGADAWVRHRQAQKSGQERHRRVIKTAPDPDEFRPGRGFYCLLDVFLRAVVHHAEAHLPGAATGNSAMLVPSNRAQRRSWGLRRRSSPKISRGSSRFLGSMVPSPPV